MANLLPTTWRRSVEDLRDNVMDTFERWLPRRWRGEEWEPTPTAPTTMMFEQGGPVVDVTEDDNEVLVTAELPGLEEKDFSVELEGGRLMLRGEKKAGREEKKRNYYFSECSYGSFMRSIPPPCEIDATKAEAKYKNGVLKVHLPKSEEAKTKRKRILVK